MYADFFGLEKEPFPVTPDGLNPFLGETHKEALAALFHGVERRRGFVQIVGEVGTGKTTILRTFLRALDPKDYATVVVFDPHMRFEELLAYIAGELGEDHDAEGYALVSRVQGRLIQEYRNGRNVVLVVDEAHNMPLQTLESLRMLSNVETDDNKLIQIVLAGQPELEELLGRQELRQLRQRIGVRAVIEPLSETEAREYLSQRVRGAGGRLKALLSDGATDEIIRYAGGVPRVLNIAADTTLIHALGAQCRPATRALAREALKSLGSPRAKRSRHLVAASVLGMLTLAALAWTLYDKDRSRGAVAHAVPARNSDAGSEAPNVLPPVPVAADAHPAIDSGAVAPKSEPDQAQPIEQAAVPTELATDTQGPVAPAVPELTPVDAESLMRVHRRRIKWDKAPLPEEFFPAQYTARAGDLISQLCVDIYGFASDDLYEMLLAVNPALTSVDMLQPGQALVFPPLTPALQQMRQEYIAYKLRTRGPE